MYKRQPEGEADKVIAVVREVMEQATRPVMDLSVPLVVDANAARTWADAH